ncbi:hypothetical protein J921_1083 [Acinetobacter baumannii 25493_8]|nr:hypothetical protein C7R87_1681 [Acinetobacter baumannii]ETQ01371.1 hypothetical protein P645_2452 [Acinetobacter baumannii UH10707]ETQ70136.1 hypothetical protein P665_2415 [Acinetobacter baumannii UH2907]ETR26065.1 hypothetical protein P677_0930 [Acinetobacter baumannii UH7707]EXA75761.1 hypothetical protein J523_3697 [Acinetobacter baumannii 1202252]EXC50744.1 hypothetical protein J470_3656 [Acinetobacter baumannii 1032241]EXC64951.1 hypothetical protein J489_0954 [Acinetobacter baumann
MIAVNNFYVKGPEHSGLFLNRFNANSDIYIAINCMCRTTT